MKTWITSTLLVASLTVVGCGKKDDASTQMKTAQDQIAKEAADAMGKVKGGAADAADQTKDMAKSNADSMVDAAKQMTDQIDKLMDQAKAAVKDKKWDDANNYVEQAKGLKNELPAAAQTKIDVAIADVQKLIDAGKKLTPAG